MATDRDYQKEYEARKNLSYRVTEYKDLIKVSKTKKDRISITIHPYLKEQYLTISDNISADFEEFVKNKVEEKLGKRIILKS